MSELKQLQRALSLTGLDVPMKQLDAIVEVINAYDEKEEQYSLQDAAAIIDKMKVKYHKPCCRYKYEIIPVSFKDMNEYVDELNKLGKEGWIVKEIMNTYEDSPVKGVTTHDRMCVKILRNASPDS